MEKTFKSYSSFDNKTSKSISQIKKFNCTENDKEWISIEKIHGANLSFITDGNDILTFRRSGLILQTENFYNSDFVMQKCKSSILKIFEKSKIINNSIINVQIYGEIFGGYYPNVERLHEQIIVLQGVYYCNYNDFLIFDIKLCFNDKNQNKKQFIVFYYLFWIFQYRN